MKKNLNYLLIPAFIIMIFSFICRILYNVDMTLIILISLILIGYSLVIINKKIPEKIKLVFLLILMLVIFLISLNNFYLKSSVIITLILSSIILTIINKNISLITKVPIIIILLITLFCNSIFFIEANRMFDLKEPLLAKKIDVSENIYTYKGIFYKVKLIKDDSGNIQEGTIYILNREVSSVKTLSLS